MFYGRSRRNYPVHISRSSKALHDQCSNPGCDSITRVSIRLEDRQMQRVLESAALNRMIINQKAEIQHLEKVVIHELLHLKL
jgi:hypothetical protein